ncbi:MAG: ABC transporter permease [Ignavibacteria bacterium]|nr:ABC transporter permease [Ignavibacteria bacterium]
MKTALSVLVIETKLFLRERAAVFFTFLFPLFLLFLFGSIWGSSPDFFGMLTPMLLAIVTFSGALYSVGLVLAYYREGGILKRISLTPLKPRNYMYGIIAHRFLVVFLQSLFLLAIPVLVLGLTIRGDLLSLLLFLSLGILSLLSIGGVVAGLSRSITLANAIAKVVFVPLMFLSGAFMPISMYPEFLQKFAKINPIHHYIKGLQNIILEGHGLADESERAFILLALLLVCFVISKKTILQNTDQ